MAQRFCISLLSCFLIASGPDGDKSVSISFTSVGKALASRSHSHTVHPHPHSVAAGVGAGVSGIYDNSSKQAERQGNSVTIPLSTSNSINLGGSNTNLMADANPSTRMNDHMTLDDVSDNETGTAHEEGNAVGVGAGANVRTNSTLATGIVIYFSECLPPLMGRCNHSSFLFSPPPSFCSRQRGCTVLRRLLMCPSVPLLLLLWLRGPSSRPKPK